MSQPHPQAYILRAIADGKTIEGRYLDSPWVVLPEPWTCNGWEFRIKPETISVAGHEFPAPVREPLEDGTKYWQPQPGSIDLQSPWLWSGHRVDEFFLKRGLVQLTKEGAIAQAKVMIAAHGLLAALQEIADHHEHQRELWTEDLEDADHAEYHERRRDFALAAIAKAIGCEA